MMGLMCWGTGFQWVQKKALQGRGAAGVLRRHTEVSVGLRITERTNEKAYILDSDLSLQDVLRVHTDHWGQVVLGAPRDGSTVNWAGAGLLVQGWAQGGQGHTRNFQRPNCGAVRPKILSFLGILPCFIPRLPG